MRRYRGISLLLSALLILPASPGGLAWAQQDSPPVIQPSPADADPPTRAGRLSYLAGAVSIQPAGIDQWTVAELNRPLTSGDALWSDRGSRAEIELGSATIAIGDSSSIELLSLTDRTVQLKLAAGTANIALRELGGGFEVDAPNAAVALLRPGSYRIGVDAGGNTTVAMRSGQAQIVTADGRTVTLRGGQGAVFGAGGDIDVATLGAPDEFDRWCAQRNDRRTRAAAFTQYLSSDAVGAEELQDYGEWSQEPDYGYVWYPTQVPVDWAPYRYGHWLWVAPWGWTWVDDAPWGYAPFHYGRWAYLHEQWGWVPAPAHRAAVYAPALVAWIGGSGEALVIASGAGIGWVPLAPGEVYVPAYRASSRYVENLNVSNITIVDNSYISSIYRNPSLQNRYANREVPHGLTVVPQRSFTSGQPIATQAVNPSRDWQTLAATPRAPPIAPVPQSLLGPRARTPVAHPPVAIDQRQVVARHAPPPRPPPFEEQLKAIEANGAKPLPQSAAQAVARPNVVLAAPTPALPAALAPPPLPTPRATLPKPIVPPHVAPLVNGAPAPPAAGVPSVPADRRVIPERSPLFQSQPPSPDNARAIEREAPAPAPLPAQEGLPAPPPPQGTPASKGRNVPPPDRIEGRKGEQN